MSVPVHCGACTAVARAAEMAIAITAAVPTVAHSVVVVIDAVISVAAREVVTAVAVAAPAVSATVSCVERWTSEVEVVAVGVARIDVEMPTACAPIERTIEVCGCAECLPLPV